MVWYLTKPFEKEGDDLLSWSSTVLIPTDNLSETYSIDDASISGKLSVKTQNM